MKKILFGALAIGSLGLAANQPTANLYTCQGDDAEVHFTRTSFVGKPTFSVRYEGQDVKLPAFPEVKSQRTSIGEIVSVTDNHLVPVDGPSIRYSLVLPSLALDKTTNKTVFETKLVKTSVVNPFFRPTPYIGVEEINEYVDVECTASHVLF